jgi:hypothetical protein
LGPQTAADFIDIRFAYGLHCRPAMLRAVVVVLIAAGCDVGSVLPEGGAGAQPDAGGGSGSGSGSGSAAAAPLQITLTASATAAPVYSPSHVLVVWVQDQAGAIVKTISRHADIRKVALVAWQQKAGTNDVDAISGATRIGYTPAATVSWDLKNRQGTVVPDGTYTIRMEVADTNATTAGQNNQGTFTFVKGAQPQMQTGLTNGGFSDVSINFTPQQ